MSAPPRLTSPNRPTQADATHPVGITKPGARLLTWRRATRLLLAGLSLLAVAWAMASLTGPPGFDHGLYVWTADVVLRGGMVYADAWDMHGPLVAYLYAVPQALVGQQFWGVRLLDILLVGGAAFAAARVMTRAMRIGGASGRLANGTTLARAAGWWVAVIVVLAYASNGSQYTAQPDGWVGLATTLILAPVALAPRPQFRHLVLAGFVVGLFALIKPFYGVFVFVPLSYWAVDAGRDWGRSARGAAVAALVSAVPIAAAVAWFASRSALGALVDVHLRYTAQTYAGGGLHLGTRLSALVTLALSAKIVPVLLGSAAAGAAALWRRGERALLSALTVWIALAVFCVLLQNKYYYYHWIPLYQPLILLGAVGLASALSASVEPAGRALAAASVVVISVHAAVRPTTSVLRWAPYAIGRSTLDTYYRTFVDDGLSGPSERMRAGRYLRERTLPSATVAMWGPDPGVLYYARRAAPFRIGAWTWPVTNAYGTPVQARYAAEYLRDLRTRTPDYFVVNTRFTARPQGRLSAHPEIAREIDARFVLDTTIGPYHLLRRRAPAAAAP